MREIARKGRNRLRRNQFYGKRKLRGGGRISMLTRSQFKSRMFSASADLWIIAFVVLSDRFLFFLF